jgi:hypothetical protein
MYIALNNEYCPIDSGNVGVYEVCLFIRWCGLKVTKKGCPKTAFSIYSQKKGLFSFAFHFLFQCSQCADISQC